MSRSIYIASVSALMALYAVPPSAAQQDPERILDKVSVDDVRPQSLTAQTAEGAAESLSTLAGAGSVIDAETLRTTRAQSLADALRLAPGVFAAPRFGDEDLRLSIRGSGIVRTGHGKGVLVLRDGVAVNQADGNFDPPVLDFASASHITVLRGGAALGVGASTLGGVIETHSKTGSTHPGASVSYSTGSFGYQRASADIGGARGRFDAFASVTAGEADGYREQSATDTLRVSANTGLRLAENLETRLFAGLVETDALWPGTLTRAEYLADPGRAAVVSIRRDQRSDIDQKFLSSRTVLDLGTGQLSLTAGWNDRFKFHPTPGGILNESSETLSTGLLWSSSPDHGPWFTEAGVRYAAMDQDATTFAYAGGLNSPVSSLPGALLSDRVREATNTEAYARLGYQIRPALVLSGSLAYLSTDRNEARSAIDPTTSPAFDLSFEEWLPGLGLVWRPAETWSAFASLTRTAEAPTFFDLGGNQPLQPDRIPRLRIQTADTIEVGTRGRISGWRWDATVYHARIDGELQRLDAAGALNPPILNADKTLRTGLELASELEVTDGLWTAGPSLTLAGKYDWLWARFDDDALYGDNRIAGVPEHSAFVEARFGFGERFSLTPNLTWRGPTRTDLYNTISAEATLIVGLNAALEVDNIKLWVEGRNLTDERWVSSVNVVNRAQANSGLFFPGDAASIYAGLSLRR